ncbi:MAG: hypothetical protein MUC67_00720 [Acidobacteria bacterium]|nr:hypothetical protein [Acidobacteriota bacterium]
MGEQRARGVAAAAQAFDPRLLDQRLDHDLGQSARFGRGPCAARPVGTLREPATAPLDRRQGDHAGAFELRLACSTSPVDRLQPKLERGVQLAVELEALRVDRRGAGLDLGRPRPRQLAQRRIGRTGQQRLAEAERDADDQKERPRAVLGVQGLGHQIVEHRARGVKAPRRRQGSRRPDSAARAGPRAPRLDRPQLGVFVEQKRARHLAGQAGLASAGQEVVQGPLVQSLLLQPGQFVRKLQPLREQPQPHPVEP